MPVTIGSEQLWSLIIQPLDICMYFANHSHAKRHSICQTMSLPRGYEDAWSPREMVYSCTDLHESRDEWCNILIEHKQNTYWEQLKCQENSPGKSPWQWLCPSCIAYFMRCKNLEDLTIFALQHFFLILWFRLLLFFQNCLLSFKIMQSLMNDG